MSDAFSVECPQCHARLKLKSRSAVGKRVPCPKCKKPFVVAAPTEEDDMAFLNVTEPDADEFDSLANEEEDLDELPAAPTSRSKSRGKKRAAADEGSDFTKWLVVGTGALVAVGLLIAGIIIGVPLLATWAASTNKIDTAFLPPEADLILHARLSEAWAAPFVQSLVSNQNVKPQLDRTWGQLGIDPSRVESITIGTSGTTATMKEIVSRGVPGLPNGAAGPTPPSTTATGPVVIVVRTKTTDALSKIRDKFKNGRTAKHQGMEYLIPPVGGDIALFFATNDTLVTGTEENVKRAIEWGRKGVRRPDLDFVDPTQMILLAIVPKDPTMLDAPPPGPGVPAGALSALSEKTRGKVKGICIGLSASDKVDWSFASNCVDKFVADDVAKAMETSLADAKKEFAQQIPHIPEMFSEFVKLADDMLNSIHVSSGESVVAARGSVPASSKSTLEKIPMLLMMGMLPGGGTIGEPGPNPIGQTGAPGSQGFTLPTGGQSLPELPPGTLPPGTESLGGTPAGTVTPPGQALPTQP